MYISFRSDGSMKALCKKKTLLATLASQEENRWCRGLLREEEADKDRVAGDHAGAGLHERCASDMHTQESIFIDAYTHMQVYTCRQMLSI